MVELFLDEESVEVQIFLGLFKINKLIIKIYALPKFKKG